MITKQVWLKTILAIFLSICIAFYVNQFFKSISEQVGVVVASENIPAQTQITSNMLKTVQVRAEDRSLLVPNAFTDIQAAVGMVTLTPLKAGEVVISEADKLVLPNESVSGIPSENKALPKAFFIPPDQRAISLKVDAEGTLGFSLNAGDKVDVIFTSTNGEMGGIYSKTILKNITIFDIKTISEKDRESSSNLILQNVTLLVSPEEAQLLALSKRKGKIDFILTPLNPDSQDWDLTKPTYPQEIYEKEIINR